MSMKRLNFLLGSVSGLAVVANTEHLFAKALAQAPLRGIAGRHDRVLVLLNLQGGNDGLNTVVPHGNQRYYQLRPHLAIGAERRAADRRSARVQSHDEIVQGHVR